MRGTSQFFGDVKSLIVRRPWVSVLIAAIVLGGAVYLSKNNTPTLKFAEVKRGEVSQVISVTGIVKPSEEVKLSFEKAGRVAWINKKVGDEVLAGQILASLDISVPLSALNQEKAKLDQLRRGSRPEEIAVKEAEVEEARQSLKSEYGGGVSVLNDSYVKAEDAVRVKTSNLFSGNRATGYSISFIACDTQTETLAEGLRGRSEDELNVWKNEKNSLPAAPADELLEENLSSAQNHLLLFRDLLESLSALLNQSCTLQNSSYDSYRTNVGTGRTNIATAITNVSEKISDIGVAKAALLASQSALALTLSGSDPEEIRAQKAKVANAEANLRTYQLVSPISGIVTREDAKIGEIASVGTPIASVISKGRFEIEANTPEADIAKIKVGVSAEVTLDAYGSDILFFATVTEIEPAETIIEGVATYKTTLQFKEDDGRIKSGMTANTDIYGEKRENVLFIPSRAAVSKGVIKTVTLIEGGTEREVTITTGLRGTSGDIEVLSGLNEGDRVKLN